MAKEIQVLNNGDALYDIRRKINENFELVQEEVEEVVVDPLVKFGVNEGNVTDGVADLLTLTDSTLSFKVGGDYLNLVITSGDGVTQEIESVNDLYLQNLADGEYTVVVDGSNSNITDAEFYSQLLEPENPNTGDVWFNGESAKQFVEGLPSGVSAGTHSINFRDMANIGDRYLAVGVNGGLLASSDKGQTWNKLTPAVSGELNYIGCVVYEDKFYIITSDRRLLYVDSSWTVWSSTLITESTTIAPNRLRNVNNTLVATTDTGIIYSNNGLDWTTIRIDGGQIIKDICYLNGMYYAASWNSYVYSSADLKTWTKINKIFSALTCMKVYNDKILLGTTSGSFYVYDLTINEGELKQGPISGNVNDIAVIDNGVLIVGSYNLCAFTSDLKNFEQIYTTGGNLVKVHNNFILGDTGLMLRIEGINDWIAYTYIPVGEVTISGGEVTYFTTYPYNSNGLHEATSSTFGLLRVAAQPDLTDCSCNNAAITPANLYNIANYRLANTDYEINDAVGCPYHHNLQLRCIIAGTTSNELLDTTGERHAGDQIQDGTVTWQIEELGTGGAGGGGLEIGDIGIATLGIDETQNKRRYINGQLIIQEQFVSFTNKVKKAQELYPNLFCTEEEWQATVTMSTFGQCGKFVIDDEAGTIRLPKITGFIQGLTDLASLGELVEAGLPTLTTNSTGAHTHTRGTMNITGQFCLPGGGWWGGSIGNGAFWITDGGLANCKSSGDHDSALVDFNASRNWTGATSSNGAHTHTISDASGVLGKSNTVQPESVRYPYFIQVATGVEETIDTTREIELNNPFFFGYYQYFETAPNNISWLKSQGQWNDKAVYTDYYDWILTNANNGVANFKLSTDTYDDYAWVVNTADETFRLPIKTKNAPFTVSGATTTLKMGTVSVYGTGKGLGLYNGSSYGSLATSGSNLSVHTAYYNSNVSTSCANNSTCGGIMGVVKDASKSGLTGSVSGTATTSVSTEENTNVSLYFYVGETVQNVNLINAGRIEEKVSKINADKLDKSAVKAYITETYVNGASGYNIYSNGYIEQWGLIQNNSASGTPITYLKPMKNTQYNLICSWNGNSADNYGYNYHCINPTITGATLIVHMNSTKVADGILVYWKVTGYIA